MAAFSRIRKWIFRTLLTLVLLVSVALAGGYFWLQTSDARTTILALMEKEISAGMGYDVKLTGLTFTLPADVRMESLTITDEKSAWLTAKDVRLGLMPSLDLAQSVTLYHVKAKSLALLRAPLPPKDTGPSSGTAAPDVRILSLALDDITLAPEITQLPEALQLQLAGNLLFKGSNNQLQFSLNGHAPALMMPQLNNANFALDGTFDVMANSLTLSQLSVDAEEALQLSGNASLDLTQETISAALESTVAKLGAWQEGVEGSAKATLALSGQLASPAVNGKGSINGVNYAGTPVPDLAWEASAQQNDTLAGTLKLTGISEAIALSTHYVLADQTLSFKELDASYQGCEAKGDIAANLDTLLADGTLSGKCADLTVLTPYVPQLTSGALDYKLALAAKDGKQTASVEADAKNLVTTEASAKTLSVKTQFSDVPNQLLPEQLSAKATGLNAQGNTVDVLEATIEPADGNWKFDIAAKANTPVAYNVNTRGTLSMAENDDVSVALSSFSGTVDGYALALKSPASVGYAQQKITWDIAQINVENMQLATTGSFKGDALETKTKVKNLKPAEWSKELPQALAASVFNGDVNVSGTLSEPVVKLDATLAGVASLEEGKPLTLPIKLDYAKQRAHVITHAKQGTLASADVDVTVPFDLSLAPFKAELLQEGALGGDVALNGDVTKLGRMFLPVEHLLSGKVSGKLALAGSVANPSAKGNITLSDGSYQYPSLGMKLEKLTASLQAQGNKLLLQNVQAQDAKGNKLTATGSVTLAGAQGMSFEANVAMKDMALLNHPNAQGTINGQMALKGDSTQASITGTLIPRPVEIRIPEKFNSELPQLNVVEKKEAKDEAPAAYPVALDITIDAGEQIFIRGWGVDAEIGGKLVITGTAANPEIKGKLATKRGRYEEFGKLFIIKEGTVTFEGDMPPSPYLNIVASVDAGDVEVKPTISGPLLDPALSIGSTPSMPQDEVLSHLLFGKNARDISPLQAAQLAQSLRKLSGKGGGGFDPLGRARELLGVDDLKVNNDSGNTEDTTVGVGKYIREDVYLEIERGAQAGSGKARIEVEVTPNISVDSTTGEAGQSSVGVQWKHDY